MKVELGETLKKIQELDGEEYEVKISIKPSKKIEKLDHFRNDVVLIDKINEIIDKLNEMEK